MREYASEGPAPDDWLDRMAHDEDGEQQTQDLRAAAAPGTTSATAPGTTSAADRADRRDQAVRAAVEQGVVGPAAPVVGLLDIAASARAPPPCAPPSRRSPRPAPPSCTPSR